MKLERKIEIQQKMINKLQEEKQQLLQENRDLLERLELEKAKPRDGYEKTKQLEIELSKCIKTYKDAMKALKQIQVRYQEKMKELNELKAKYEKDMKKVIKSVKKDFAIQTNKNI